MTDFNTRIYKACGLAMVALALAGCGKAGDAEPASTGKQAVVDEAATDAAAAGALPDGDAPLKEGQAVQGTISADVGNGSQDFRSLSTKVADDIGEQVDDKLGTGEGQRALDDANRKLEKMGVDARVSDTDVRDIVGGMAGKTFHDASVMQVDIIKSLQVSLKGTASDGAQLDLAMTFDDTSLTLTSSNFTYRPKANAMFDFYEAKDKEGFAVTVERFERNADGTYAIAGSFTAKDVPASAMAKKLPSASLPSASGRFDYASLPLKQMPKFGK